MIRTLAHLTAGVVEVVGVLVVATVCLVVIACTEEDIQAELVADEPEPVTEPEPDQSPWEWAPLRQQPLARATRDVGDAEAVFALMARPL